MSLIKQYILPGLALLPEKMDSPEARAMLVAIGLQESGYRTRKQIGGPARGFHQFERSGVAGILNHPKTTEYAQEVCRACNVKITASDVYEHLAYDDALDCAFARLLLWTLPSPLPKEDNPDEGWRQYLAAWRPGKPRPDEWPNYFKQAWEMVKGEQNDGTKLS